jgi:lipopolysaccharide export system protein LptA
VSAVRWLVPCLALALLASGVRGGAQEVSADGLRIGVAPFERVAAAGSAVPDIANSLAQRLSTKGVGRVVGPQELGGSPAADPPAEDVVARAMQAEVDVVVVGRTTRLGDSLSVDTRLRSGINGAPLGAPVVVEASAPSDLGRAIDELAALVLEAAHRDPEVATIRLASRPLRGEPAPNLASKKKEDGSEEKEPFQSDAPISITSDLLEAFDKDGRKKFVFTGRVRAKQDDLHLTSDRMEAFYPKGQSQPERMVATGHVEITQTGKRACCEKATYFRTEEKLVCVGDNARLDEDCDLVYGKEIVFHLDTEVLEVNGAADVKIHPEGSECRQATSCPWADL